MSEPRNTASPHDLRPLTLWVSPNAVLSLHNPTGYTDAEIIARGWRQVEYVPAPKPRRGRV